jgi:integrase/recombinase XerD
MILSKAIEGFLIELAGEGYSQRTIDLYNYDLIHLVEFLGDVELESITRHDLVKFMKYLREDYRPGNPVSGSWLDNHWKALRTFYRWAGSTMGIENAAINLSRPKYKLPPVTPLTADEIKKILKACEQSNEINAEGKKPYRAKRPTALRDKALVLLLLDTGVRLGELCRLKVEHVNLATGEIRIIGHGSGVKSRPRTVFLGKQAKKALWMYLASREDEDEPSLFGIRDSGVQQMLRNCGKRAGVRNVHPHRFRHTFAIMYLRNGGDVFTLQRLLGHSDLETVKHYLNLVKADLEGAHRRASPADNL